jgi:hypothetical protein
MKRERRVSKEKKRKLTPFLCQELLYDYAIDSLDADRKAAVEEHLEENAESRRTLETIHKGFKYAAQLSDFEISESLTGRLQQSENIVSVSKKISNYSAYPDWVKWSLASILASLCVAMIAVVVPWKTIIKRSSTDNKTVVLAPLSNENEEGETQDDTVSEHESSGDFDESGAPVEDPVPTPQATVVAAKPTPTGTIPPLEKLPKVAAATPKPIVLQKPIATPVPKPIAVVQPPAVSSPEQPMSDAEGAVVIDAAAAAATEAASVNEVAGQTESRDKARGFVFRGFMTVPNIEDVSDQIVQQIKELGGAKAGEVELGWKRGTLRYFHFTLPQASEERLLELLRAYGPVRISKDPHPRVMPEGQVRFILSIDAPK